MPHGRRLEQGVRFAFVSAEHGHAEHACTAVQTCTSTPAPPPPRTIMGRCCEPSSMPPPPPAPRLPRPPPPAPLGIPVAMAMFMPAAVAYAPMAAASGGSSASTPALRSSVRCLRRRRLRSSLRDLQLLWLTRRGGGRACAQVCACMPLCVGGGGGGPKHCSSGVGEAYACVAGCQDGCSRRWSRATGAQLACARLVACCETQLRAPLPLPAPPPLPLPPSPRLPRPLPSQAPAPSGPITCASL